MLESYSVVSLCQPKYLYRLSVIQWSSAPSWLLVLGMKLCSGYIENSFWFSFTEVRREREPWCLTKQPFFLLFWKPNNDWKNRALLWIMKELFYCPHTYTHISSDQENWEGRVTNTHSHFCVLCLHVCTVTKITQSPFLTHAVSGSPLQSVCCQRVWEQLRSPRHFSTNYSNNR